MTTPIVDFVRRYAQSGTARLHMPGHKGQSLLGCEPWDITEIRGADELYEAEGIIAGEDSSYGMFVQTVDGETADDGEQEWWCLTKGGEMWNYGVDDTEIADGDVYEFTLTVGY